MAHVNGLSEIVLLDLGDLPVEHHWNACIFIKFEKMARLICVQAQVDSLVGAGTSPSVPPPFFGGQEKHARMEGPTDEPGLAQAVAFQQPFAEIGLLHGISAA
jgi:hypothetical protein